MPVSPPTSVTGPSGCPSSAMPFGWDPNVSYDMGELPVYVPPLWQGRWYDYMSAYTSVLFVVVGSGIVVSGETASGLPTWFGMCTILVGVVSTAHHVRSYHQVYHDWLRMLDVVLATAYAVVLLLLIPSPWTWGLAGCAMVVVGALKRTSHPMYKSWLHAVFHLLVLAIPIVAVARRAHQFAPPPSS